MIREALIRRDSRPVQEFVRLCVTRDAFAIDVNTGPPGRDPEAGMRFFIEAAEADLKRECAVGS
jgi:5-methyltetrahydrofolate corrinoid/iron sulfur protein methyltransferase